MESNSDILAKKDREILELNVLVFGYHQLLVGLIKDFVNNELDEEFCDCCYGGPLCDHINDPSSRCVYLKLQNIGEHWNTYEIEKIIKQVKRSKSELFKMYGNEIIRELEED